MPRTRTVIIDDEQGWIIREELAIDPADPVAPEDDYLVVQTFFPISYNAQSFYTEVVIWGVGLISFGPVTPEQRAFMANLGTNPDLSLFPGDYAAFGFSDQQMEIIQYGVREGFFYATGTSGGRIQISPDGITVIGTTSPDFYFGLDYAGYQATSSSAINLFFSDLDVTRGTGGPDTMTGFDGPETLLGLGGNDHLIGNGGGDRLEGGEGQDLLEGNDGNDRLYGGGGADQLLGGPGNDQLFGGPGNDLLDPGTGVDTVDGGTGVDRLRLDYASSDTSVYFQFTPGVPIPTAGGGSVTAQNIESVIVTGSQFSDVLIGTAYNDELFGGSGYDLLQGGAGNDLLDSGVNSGPASAVLPPAGPTLSTALPIDRFFSLGSNPNIDNSTSVPHATLNVDVQTQDAEFDQETRRYLAVTIAAGATLTVDVDGAFFEVDTRVAIYDANGNLVASNDNGAVLDPGSTNSLDSLLSFTAPTAGTYYVEITSFIANSNHKSSFAVNLSLTSATIPVADVLEGGPGNDTYIVHSQNDIIVEQSGGGTDTVRSDVSYVLGANVENLTLTGSAAINGTGNGLANTLTGNAASNTLNGLGGNDVLNGAGGNDVLIGGPGADRYVFDSALNATLNVDQLSDFNAIEDTIVLDRTVFTQLGTGALLPGRFHAGTAAHDADDRIIYDSATGKIYYDADGNGAGAAVLFAQVAPGTALTAADFLVVA